MFTYVNGGVTKINFNKVTDVLKLLCTFVNRFDL